MNTTWNRLVSIPALFVLSLFILLALAGCNQVRMPQGWSAGAVSDDTLFIGTMEGQIIAVSKDTGDTVWRRDLPTPNETVRGIYGRPAVEDDLVLVGGYDGVLYAYSRNGDPLWEERLGGRIVGGPAIVGDLAVVGTAGSGARDVGFRNWITGLAPGGSAPDSPAESVGALHVVDIEAGDPVWEYSAPGPIWSSPTLADGVAFFGSMDHRVYAVDVVARSEKWSFPLGGAVVSGIAVADGLAIFGGFDSRLYALDAETGEFVWSFDDASRWYWATPVIHQGVVYAPSLDGTLYALDARSGSLLWKRATEGQLVGSPAIVNGLIALPIADGDDSRIALLEVNGSEQSACRIGSDVRTSLEVSGDLLYFAATDHTVRALRIKSNGNPDEEWVYLTDADDPIPSDRSKAC